MGSTEILEHRDVVIIGAGISGIAAAVELQRSCPSKSFVMLEMRDSIGGTWDLFKYPGIRSDSDMFTLGFGFKPWTAEKAIANASDIMVYLHETISEFDLESKIRLNQHVISADWSDDDCRWTLVVEDSGEKRLLTCEFVYTAAGYYDYESGFTPEFPGLETFMGRVVHPQFWPSDLDYSGKRVAVIGSGATAITLVPALADRAEMVTMVQRSPSYVYIESDVDEEASKLRSELDEVAAFEAIRNRNLANQQANYVEARSNPEGFKASLFEAIESIVGREVRERHFTPAYEPWDQRLCLVPNGDLFHAIADGDAQVVTGRIKSIAEHGIVMDSGEEVPADVIVTATGLELVTLGGINFSLNGTPIDFSERWSYKGSMYSGVPNLINAFGYINSSWTLRIELLNRFWCRLLNHMSEIGAARVIPTLRASDADMAALPWISDVNSGYLMRGMSRFPRQGDRAPWINPQVHESTRQLFAENPSDGVLVYS
jgi:monooxygenase